MPRFDKYTLQTLGFVLVVVGFLLFVIGLLTGPTSSPSCALNGPCPPVPLPWYYWVPTVSFFSSIALIIVGIILLIVARRMKPDPAKNKLKEPSYGPNATHGELN